MNNPALPNGLGCELRFRGFEGQEATRKNFSRFSRITH